MVHGETTTRSPFDADDVIARLRARGVEQLCGEAGIWVILDGSDVRKPYAQAMEGLQPVKRLSGGGMVPGYRTINAIGIGVERRGLLYHRLFSSTADDFVSESAETQRALAETGAALAPLGAAVTYILDAGFDDIAVWDTGYPLGGMGARGTSRLSSPGSHAARPSNRRCPGVSSPGMRGGLTATGTGGNGTGRAQDRTTTREVAAGQRGRRSGAARVTLPARGTDDRAGRMAGAEHLAGGSALGGRRHGAVVVGD